MQELEKILEEINRPTESEEKMKERYENPSCYIAEKNNPYPLCIGRGLEQCNECCLYVDMTSPYDT